MQPMPTRALDTTWIHRLAGILLACAALLVTGCGGGENPARFRITLLPSSVAPSARAAASRNRRTSCHSCWDAMHIPPLPGSW